MDIFLVVLLIVICLGVEAFFSGSEIAVVSADRAKLRHAAASGSRGAALALRMLKAPEWLLSTTLAGTNLALVTSTTAATMLVIYMFGEVYSWLAVVVLAPLTWVFGEIVPKSVFQQRADKTTLIAIFVLRFVSIIFWPILWIFAAFSIALRRWTGGGERNPFTLREEIQTLVEMSESEGDIRPEEQTMIRRIFDFSETNAGEIMVPLIDVIGVEGGTSCGEAMKVAIQTGHKRLPVYEQRVDRISGALNTLDILLQEKHKPISQFVQPVVYVSASKSIRDLLLAFSKEDVIVVVVDEFGGADGIVMLEDVLEEIVGELDDELDVERGSQPMIRQIDRRHVVMSARVQIDTINDTFDLNLPEGDYETVAGFLIGLVGEIPEIGEMIRYRNISFTVVKATRQAIHEVRVRW